MLARGPRKLIRHNLGNTKQNDERQEQQVDIRLHLAGTTQPADSLTMCLRADEAFGPSAATAARRRATASSRSMRWKK